VQVQQIVSTAMLALEPALAQPLMPPGTTSTLKAAGGKLRSSSSTASPAPNAGSATPAPRTIATSPSASQAQGYSRRPSQDPADGTVTTALSHGLQGTGAAAAAGSKQTSRNDLRYTAFMDSEQTKDESECVTSL
jgi:hypothetical protein